MRTSFKLKYTAKDYLDARFKALEKIALFLSINEADVEEKVSLELKIGLNKSTNTEDNYSVTVFAQMKNSVAFSPKQ